MISSVAEPSVRTTKSVFVHRQNRPFPRDDTFGKPSASAPPVELATTPEQADLAEQLTTGLWSQLPFAGVDATDAADKGTLVRLYTESLGKLHSLQTDVRSLVRAVCAAGFEFRQLGGVTDEGAKQLAMEQALEEMVRDIATTQRPIENALTSTLVASHTPRQLLVTFRRALEAALARFAEDFERTLEALVDRQVAGLIDWTDSQTCCYHFFRHVVLQDNHGKSESFGPTRLNRRSPTGWSQVVTETEGGEHIFRRARHEHHVMHAFHTSPANSRVPMPARARRLLQAIPAWLYPFIRIVDGDLFRERIVEQDLKRKQWGRTRVREVPVENRDDPVYGWEPAIIIGGFVLTGWGPKEVVAVQTQQQERVRDSQRRRHGRESLAWCGPACCHSCWPSPVQWQPRTRPAATR